MGNGYGPFVAMYTAISVVGIAWRINSVMQRLLPDDIPSAKEAPDPTEAAHVLQSLLQSTVTIAFVTNLVLNFFLLVALFTKTLFFGQLSLLETQKVVERLINYVLFKGLFLTWVIQPEIMAMPRWLAWFSVLGFLKMFQGLARDRLDRLNASPTASIFAHVRVYVALVLVLISDLFWMRLCIWIFNDTGKSTFLLQFFEPLSIAFDTLQAVVVHGMQLLDIWQRLSVDVSSQAPAMQPFERSAAGAAWEWRGALVRNWSFVMDIMSLILSLGHCVHIWWHLGLNIQVVDAILFLKLRALLSAISKRIKGFMRLRTAMSTLQGALPDASSDELLNYDDDCAICKEPMARAKRLPCAHLFHLSCLRSWLDQGLADNYSCPTCRRPLFMGSSRAPGSTPDVGQRRFRDGGNPNNTFNIVEDRERLGLQQMTLQPGAPAALSVADALAQEQWNVPVTNTWRGGRVEQAWTNNLPGEGGGQPSEASPHGIGRMQRMMRHLSGHAQTDDNSWVWWPLSRGPDGMSLAARQSIDNHGLQRQDTPTTGPRLVERQPELSITVDPRMVGMLNMVREVLPHLPDDLIIQDLRRTNSVTATVNNFL